MLRFKQLFSIGLLVFCFIPQAYADPALKIMADVRRPYAWWENGAPHGINYDLVILIMQELNQDLPIEFTSFNRGLQLAQTQPNTAFFSVTPTPERRLQLKWVGPLVQSDVYIYKLKNAPVTIASMADLQHQQGIGVPRGMLQETFLRQKGFKIKQFDDIPKALLGLKNRRVDCVAVGPLALRAAAREVGLDPALFEQTPVKLYENPLYIAFSKDVGDETIQRWQNALDKVKRKHYARLSSQYLN